MKLLLILGLLGMPMVSAFQASTPKVLFQPKVQQAQEAMTLTAVPSRTTKSSLFLHYYGLDDDKSASNSNSNKVEETPRNRFLRIVGRVVTFPLAKAMIAVGFTLKICWLIVSFLSTTLQNLILSEDTSRELEDTRAALRSATGFSLTEFRDSWRDRTGLSLTDMFEMAEAFPHSFGQAFLQSPMVENIEYGMRILLCLPSSMIQEATEAWIEKQEDEAEENGDDQPVVGIWDFSKPISELTEMSGGMSILDGLSYANAKASSASE